MNTPAEFLTEPFLQFPTINSVRVVWFTEFPGRSHYVNYGKTFSNQVIAKTRQLTRTREDELSYFRGQTKANLISSGPVKREIWRHEALIEGLKPAEKLPYRVTSVKENNQSFTSDIFTLAAAPLTQQPLKILLTSDHQLKPMTAANLQKVVETIGQVDAVFLAGDLVNIPDRASEWFDDDRGGAFFPCLQGRASFKLVKNGRETVYQGGQIIQNAPLFPATGNHEIMGRFSEEENLDYQFNDTVPKQVALDLFKNQSPTEKEIKNNSFNTDTYQEIFSLPTDKNYYAVTFGDIRLVSLYVTNMWRTYKLDEKLKGKYQEPQAELHNPQGWGYGQHIYEPIKSGSEQYQWLEKELNSPEFKQAKYKVVMLHHPPHSLGDNIVPPFTDPVAIIAKNQAQEIVSIRYEYPQDQDYIIQDLIPLLEKAGVQLVYYGHCHLWNRFISSTGLHFLESSNVGNSYGAAFGNQPRIIPPEYQQKYVSLGDANALEPVYPSLVDILGKDGKPQPFIASNDLTVFSIFDTQAGAISSYYFDTRNPESPVIKFDQFFLAAS